MEYGVAADKLMWFQQFVAILCRRDHYAAFMPKLKWRSPLSANTWGPQSGPIDSAIIRWVFISHLGSGILDRIGSGLPDLIWPQRKLKLHCMMRVWGAKQNETIWLSRK